MDTEQWIDLSRKISRYTGITGNVSWEDGNFSSSNRKNLTKEMLLQKGFTPQKKEGCDPDYIEYHLIIDSEKTIILYKDFNVFSNKEYFRDSQFEWPTDLPKRTFYFEDQIDAYIEWAKRVTLKAYKENSFV